MNVSLLRYIFVFLLLVVLFFPTSCSTKSNKVNEHSNQQVKDVTEVVENPFIRKANSVFEIKTFDGNRILEYGQGFLISNTMLVAPFSLFREANRAEITSLNGGNKIEINSYYLLDRINNIILLKVDSLKAEPLKFYVGEKEKGLKTIQIGIKQSNTLPIYSGSYLQEKIIEGRKLYSISNNISIKSQGTPVFVSNGGILGMGISMEVLNERANYAIPSAEIMSLINKKGKAHKLTQIGSNNEKRNSTIKNIVLETTSGNIEVRLFNETKTYRDNFLKLAEEGFYDSLLIHRVIKNFGIQTGAADTRHAQSDDIVGWKGPGYTLPSHIVAGLFHKRGAIGSPRKPDSKNKDLRSDGSQFYIVSGRVYLNEELNDIEIQNNIKFTPEQRQVYTTIGGAPHLDGTYTVFGEVVSGIEIVDKISLFPVDNEFRPLTDIRLKRVRFE